MAPPIAPAVKALAAEHGIDLAAVVGTGKNGAIKKVDVEALIPGGGPSSSPNSSAANAPAKDAPAKAAKEYRCPGCGRTYPEAGECSGGEFGHAPLELEPAA